MKDVYEKFAYDYDEFGPIEDYLGDERDFFRKLFDTYHTRTVLDCACGTGQHLYLFHSMALAVAGSDLSLSMLDTAGKNLSKNNISLPLVQCDFRYLEREITEKFDAVVCLTTSLPHLHTDDDLLLALRSMKSRLNNGGILVLTQGITHRTLEKSSHIEVIVNREDFSRVFIKEKDDRFLTIHILDLFHSKKRTEHNQYDIIYRILLDDDYRRLLNRAGFSDIRIYGDYQMNEYSNEYSRRLIVVAQI